MDDHIKFTDRQLPMIKKLYKMFSNSYLIIKFPQYVINYRIKDNFKLKILHEIIRLNELQKRKLIFMIIIII
jgi:hypothetical protein